MKPMNPFVTSLLISIFFSSVSQAAIEIGFDQALNTLVETNTTLTVQKARVDSAVALNTGAKFGFLPTLELSAADERAGDPKTEVKHLAATTRFNIFRFGADLALLDSTRYGLGGQKALLQSQELKTEDEIISALIAVIQKTQRLRVALTTLDYSKRLQDIAQARFQRGVLPREQVDQVSIDLSNAEAGVRDAQSELNRALAQVTVLSEKAGLNPELLHKEWPWKDRFAQGDIQRLAAQSVDPGSAPELKGAELLFASERAQVTRFKRLILPSLDFSYSAQRAEKDDGTRTNGWVGLLTLSVPIFEGLSDYTQYQVQSAKAAIAEQTFRQTLRDIPVRQELAQKNFTIAYQTALAREKTLSVARRLLESSLSRFRSGRANADALALDQNRFAAAELLSVDGWAQAHLALAELLHSFGQRARR